MNTVASLLGEVFLIGAIYLIFDMFIDSTKMPYISKAFAIACYAGALFLVVRFVATNLMPQILSIARITF